MDPAADPFAHHPELLQEITDPLNSFFRNFTTDGLAALMRQHGLPGGWWYSDADRESRRAKTLAGWSGDLWVFAYGSLMWDPAIRFAEVRRALAPNYERRFILKDVNGGRGTHASPGLMAALDVGQGCDGLAFRIAAEHVDAETEILWRREVVSPGYIPTFIDLHIADGPVTALTFVADHAADIIDAAMTREQQVEYCATGTGFLGTSIEYLVNIDNHFEKLGITDTHVSALLRETQAYRRRNGV